MKKFLIISLCLALPLHAMEKPGQRDVCEWDPIAYSQGNASQETSSLQFLQDSGISLHGKRVLDVGCGTGNITAIMAEMAEQVDGVDASHNMINFANETYRKPNISFMQCCAEDIKPPLKLYNVVTSWHTFHWIQDKSRAFKNIGNSLENNGEFVGTIVTSSNTVPIGLKIFNKMISELSTIPCIQETTGTNQAIGRSCLTEDEYKNIIQDAGLEIISFEKKYLEFPMNREEIVAKERPIFINKPFAKSLSAADLQHFIESYVDNLLKELKTNQDGHYLLPLETTVVHARKIEK